MPHDVFISYSNKNKVVADAVCAKLEESRIRAWIAPRDVPPGKDFASAIIHAIDECKILVLIWSEEANKSDHILNEINRAFSRNITVIPFRIDDVVPTESLEYYIGRTHWLDAITPPLEKHIKKLVDTVLPLLGRQVESDLESVVSSKKEAEAERLKEEVSTARKPFFKLRSLWPYLAGLFGVVVVIAVVLTLSRTVLLTHVAENLPEASQLPPIPTATLSEQTPTQVNPPLNPTPIDVGGLGSPTQGMGVNQTFYGIELLPGYKLEQLIHPALVNPNDIKEAPGGRIFIAEYEGHRLLELREDGTLTTYLELEKPFNSLLIDSAGNFFVTQGDEVLKITPEGESSVLTGVNYSLSTIDSHDNLYTIVEGDLLRFTPGGERSTIARGMENGDMAISPSGDIYIASGLNGKIYKVTSTGTVTALSDEFARDAFNIRFSPDGELYQNQYNFSRVSLEDGTLFPPELDEYSGFINSRPFTFTRSGDVIFIGPTTGNVIKASLQDENISVLVEGVGNSTALAVDPSGNVFLGASNDYPFIPGRIEKMASSGEIIDYAKGLSAIRDITSDDKGNLYVSDIDQQGGGRLIMIPPEGTGSVILSGFYDLNNLAIDPASEDILAFEQNSQQIIRITQSGAETPLQLDFGAEFSAIDLASDGNENIVALVVFKGDQDAAHQTSRIFKITSMDQVTLVADMNTYIPNAMVDVNGLTGDIYIGEPDENPFYQIIKFSAEDEVSIIVKHIPQGMQSLAVSDSGDIYFTCSAGLFKVSQE